EERDCTPVQREGYHPGLKDFQSVLSSFTRYRETIQVNNLSEEIAAAYVSMATKFQSDASDIKSCVNGNLC
ncbi:hypothetical protein Tco_0287839, partial [Tanacetum coccineum]